MNYVFDSSSLIYLGKSNLLEKISKLEGKKFIPKAVYEEVVSKGLERKESEAKYIEDLVKRKLFLIKTYSKSFPNNPLLSSADIQVLATAQKTNSIAVIDELYGSEVGKSYKIECHGAIYIIMELIRKKIITKKEAINALNKIVGEGFYLSTNVYRIVIKKIEET